MGRQNPSLVIMAEGMGSRFGGLKQIEPVDPEGHLIIDFSLFDAWRAGFRDVVFIIKREMEEEFRACIGDRMEKFFHVSYVYQELDRLPEGIVLPAGRTKPWGTGHALACCKGAVNGPFAVINADDFYGRMAFSEIYDFLAAQTDERQYAMVGYRLRNTVTEFGSVARGVCEIENNMLTAHEDLQEGRRRRIHRGWRAFLPADRRHDRLHEPLGLFRACAGRAVEPDARVPDGSHADKSAQMRILPAVRRQRAAGG
mgnify:CR=1 FL=1